MDVFLPELLVRFADALPHELAAGIDDRGDVNVSLLTGSPIEHSGGCARRCDELEVRGRFVPLDHVQRLLDVDVLELVHRVVAKKLASEKVESLVGFSGGRIEVAQRLERLGDAERQLDLWCGKGNHEADRSDLREIAPLQQLDGAAHVSLGIDRSLVDLESLRAVVRDAELAVADLLRAAEPRFDEYRAVDCEKERQPAEHWRERNVDDHRDVDLHALK